MHPIVHPGLWRRARAGRASWPGAAAPPWIAAPAQPLACRPTHLSPPGWLALHGAALWPHALWTLRRWQDGSDDPLGVAALVVLALLLVRARARLAVAPRPAWVAAAALLAVLANAALPLVPPLVAAAIAVASFGAALVAWTPRAPREAPAAAPLIGLALLALPLIASLQYYAGWPLRAFTAQASAALLWAFGHAAEASGAALRLDGRLVIVDAPCSGVQMAWLGYFCACATAALAGLRDAAFLRRLPAVGLIVLAANVLRNTVLVALEARPQGLGAPAHEAIGLAWLALASAAVVAWMRRRGRDGGCNGAG